MGVGCVNGGGVCVNGCGVCEWGWGVCEWVSHATRNNYNNKNSAYAFMILSSVLGQTSLFSLPTFF